MVEGFFMTEEYGFVSDLNLSVAAVYAHQSNGRRSCGCQLGCRFLADVRAVLELRLLGSQLHCKRQAGGETTVFAVCLWEQFIDF
jgi:hypothetical protein